MQGRRAAGYSASQIGLHWAILALIIGNWLLADGMRAAMRPGAEAVGTPLHVVVGMVILGLMVARLALRILRPVAAVEQNTALHWVAYAVHWLLYALLLSLPLSGVAVWFIGLSEAGDLHELLWNLLIIVALVHVGAALFHQFVLRDNLLRRMLRPSGA